MPGRTGGGSSGKLGGQHRYNLAAIVAFSKNTTIITYLGEHSAKNPHI